MLAQDPMSPPSPPKPSRNVGSRRIFPALFKLQVLDAYRVDHECKGNQRATARKFNVHRRQIQKWLQCETALRASVADALRYDATQPSPGATPSAGEPRLHEPASRVYKHDARTLKLVAQKLYPSSFAGAVYGATVSNNQPRYVPKEYQLNDTRREAIAPSGYKLTTEPVASLILKESVGGLKMCGSETRSVSNSPVLTPITSPSAAVAARIPARPQPLFTAPASPYGDEPYNLVVKTETTPPTAVTAAAHSPLPARVAEIVADSKTSAFSPKRKWLQDSMQEKIQTEPLPLLKHRAAVEPDEPKPKKPFYDFSIERLCGTKEIEVKTEVASPPLTKLPSPPPLQFPPPLLLPHRTIPDLKTLHFRPEKCSYPSVSDEVCVKQESMSDDEEDEHIDVLTTSPCEEKSFDFPLGFPESKRRSYSVQFKLNVLDAFHHDKDCNQNQRATARKFNINRRQVQKWLSNEEELRYCEGGPPCAQCPHHCAPQPPAPCFYRPTAYVPWMLSAAPIYS